MKGKKSKPKMSYGSNANVKESRLNKGGDHKFRGTRSSGKSKKSKSSYA